MHCNRQGVGTDSQQWAAKLGLSLTCLCPHIRPKHIAEVQVSGGIGGAATVYPKALGADKASRRCSFLYNCQAQLVGDDYHILSESSAVQFVRSGYQFLSTGAGQTPQDFRVAVGH